MDIATNAVRHDLEVEFSPRVCGEFSIHTRQSELHATAHSTLQELHT